MKTTTGIIRAIPDSAPQPDGLFIPLDMTADYAKKFSDMLGARLVLWRGNFYAVAK